MSDLLPQLAGHFVPTALAGNHNLQARTPAVQLIQAPENHQQCRGAHSTGLRGRLNGPAKIQPESWPPNSTRPPEPMRHRAGKPAGGRHLYARRASHAGG